MSGGSDKKGERALVPARRPNSHPPEPPSPERAYPRMRALLKNPDEVPYGFEEPQKSRPPPPVPGTFIPSPRRREIEKKPSPAAQSQDLDEMLATMAEGLLIGEDASGHTEVRVTLRD